MTSGDGVDNVMDAAGQLYEVWSGSGLQARFAFDGDGDRVKQTSDFENSIPTQTFYLRSSVLEETVAQIAIDSTRTIGYVYADGELIATQSSGMVSWQHRDASNRSVRTPTRQAQ